MQKFKGYYRNPSVFCDRIVFVAEDDLWLVNKEGGVAVRLTANLGEVSSPCFSQDGESIAFIGREEGNSDVYTISSQGGPARRLTYRALAARVLCWDKDNVIFSSALDQPFKNTVLFKINTEGGLPLPLNLGHAVSYHFQDKVSVIGRKSNDSARWKRYRGGTAGEIWLDKNSKKKYQKLFDRGKDPNTINSNLTCPMIAGDKLFFVSDHDGIANIFSSDFEGNNIEKHTFHKNFYVRNARTDGKSIVYQCGADIYCYEINSKNDYLVEINYNSSLTQRNRKFASCGKFLQDVDINKNGAKIALTSRGKPFTFSNWDGPVIQHGVKEGVRYRLVTWFNDDKRIAVITDEGGEEHLLIISVEKNKIEKRFKGFDIGRTIELAISPKDDIIALTNHRNEVILINTKNKKTVVIDKSEFQMIMGISWSPDGKWLAYGFQNTKTTSIIKIYSLEKKDKYDITEPVLYDFYPHFDPTGKYLFFISERIFNPVYDNLHFDLSFPKGQLPYVIVLNKDDKSPFEFSETDKCLDAESDNKKNNKKDKEKKEILVKIDLEGIKKRIVPLPLPEGLYNNVKAVNDRIFYLKDEPKGAIRDDWNKENISGSTLFYYDIKKKKNEVLMSNVLSFDLSLDTAALLIVKKGEIRVLSSNVDSKTITEKKHFNQESGWIDLNRVKVSVDPIKEWQQMFSEAWRLQRDFFWTEDMSGIDWKKVYKMYYPLIARVATRSEFSDLIWEMQGELGTSHAYEFGGDYRMGPNYLVGILGAEIIYKPKYNAYEIKKIYDRDCWVQKNPPPLLKPGLNVKEGMLIKAVNGYKVDKKTTPNELLVNYVSQEVLLTIADTDNKNERNVVVRTINDDSKILYRDWVEKNRDFVHKKTKGKVGYVHIPDMSAYGYAEFHRYYLTEFDYDGLIVDVRFNGGGHVSQLILEKLARKRLGYDQTRWFGVNSYPDYAVKGPIVALTNEFAGSDGDIFSHCFKLMKLGKLIGKRTWGGVIGIWARNWLVDGTITTQPEFSFWFRDVGWSVENYGTDPDIEVEISPQDYFKQVDPQLNRAINEIMKELKKNPPNVPKLNNKPNLKLI